jgi:hypothetical protein
MSEVIRGEIEKIESEIKIIRWEKEMALSCEQRPSDQGRGQKYTICL